MKNMLKYTQKYTQQVQTWQHQETCRYNNTKTQCVMKKTQSASFQILFV